MADAAAPLQVACQGCSAHTSTAFQCPLCQAEAATDRGFFCSQECFAKNWLEHRNTLHKRGVVREKKKLAVDTPAKTPETGSKAHSRKRAREIASPDQETAVGGGSTFPPWPPLPNGATCREKKWAHITPKLSLDVPRAVVQPAVTKAVNADNGHPEQSLQSCMWPALLAAAQYVASSVQRKTSASAMQVLVVAGDVYSAHAFAWAARCVGLTGMLQLAVSEQPDPSTAPSPSHSSKSTASRSDAAAWSPSCYFTSQRCIVVTTSAVVCQSALAQTTSSTAVSGASSLWLTGPPSQSLLITLPDVVDAEDLQGVQTRAVFFTGPAGLTGDRGDMDDETHGKVVYTYTSVDVACEDKQPLLWIPVALPAPGTSTPSGGSDSTASDKGTQGVAASARPLGLSSMAAQRLNNDVCTAFANGDIASALQLLVRCYQHQPGHIESCIYYTLCCNWGAASLTHAHHRLAYVARILSDHSTRFEARKNATLADAALRAIAAVCRLLPRMADIEAEAAAASDASRSDNIKTSATAKKAKRRKVQESEAESTVQPTAAALPYAPTLASTTRPTPMLVDGASAPSAQELARYANYFTKLPNLQLQATVCYLHPIAPPAVLDTFAMAWGLYRYLPGPGSLEAADRARSAAVLRVGQRLTMKLDSANGAFYVILMHLLYDAVGPYSLPVDEVDRRLLWDQTLAHDAGPLEAYLRCCGLLMADDGVLLPASRGQRVQKIKENGKAESTSATLSSRLRGSRETVRSRTEQLRCFAVKSMMGASGAAAAAASSNYGFIELPWKMFPITGERQRQVARLHTAAVEEVLMAMPRIPRPMYIGDVGNLIGKWMHFNSRFEGTLGVNLLTFLEHHPEAFKVLDNIVTRRTAGTTEQVRIRFDGDDEHGNDDSDDESGRARKTRDRQLLTGQTRGKGGKKDAIELPARARKKRAIKEFNKERFNRNYKSIDPSVRVPGYVKRGPRRIKGRGKKANKRVVKRGS